MVAALEGSPVQRLPVQTSLVVSKGDPGLLSSVESEEILVAIVVHVKVTEETEHPGVRERENRLRSTGTERERSYVYVEYVEGVRAEDGLQLGLALHLSM